MRKRWKGEYTRTYVGRKTGGVKERVGKVGESCSGERESGWRTSGRWEVREAKSRTGIILWHPGIAYQETKTETSKYVGRMDVPAEAEWPGVGACIAEAAVAATATRRKRILYGVAFVDSKERELQRWASRLPPLPPAASSFPFSGPPPPLLAHPV